MSQPAVPGHLTSAEPDLSPRQRSVFGALVRLHGRTARPVGSEALARDATLPLSAASLRAALADLEDAGLLERAHAVSGRVPSASGYEYYVRAIVEPEPLPAPLREELDLRLQGSARDVEHLLAEASRLISSFTHQLGLAHAAALEREVLVHLDLERLGASAVRTLVLELESPLAPGELAEVCEVLRERLIGHTLADVRDCMARDPELVRGSASRCVVRAALDQWSAAAPTTLFSAGVSHIAEQPEFMDAGRLGSLLRILEGVAPLDRLMGETVEGQAAVRVAPEAIESLEACSLVSYALAGSMWGAVGVLGPRRMDYARVLSVVDAVGTRVAELLHG